MVASKVSAGGRSGWRTWALGAGVLAGLQLLPGPAGRPGPAPEAARPSVLAALAARLDRLEARAEPQPQAQPQLQPAPASTPALDDRLAQLEHRLAQLNEVDDWNEAVRVGVARALAARATAMTPRQESHLAALIIREARANRLDPLLVAAVMQVESGFNPYAVSSVGAVGLMQLMPATATDLDAGPDSPASHLFDMDRNVALGCRYLASLIDRFGKVEPALVAYNMGPSAAAKALASPRARSLLQGYPRLVTQARARMAQPLMGPSQAQVVAAVARVAVAPDRPR